MPTTPSPGTSGKGIDVDVAVARCRSPSVRPRLSLAALAFADNLPDRTRHGFHLERYRSRVTVRCERPKILHIKSARPGLQYATSERGRRAVDKKFEEPTRARVDDRRHPMLSGPGSFFHPVLYCNIVAVLRKVLQAD
jgi:hypothetical protein